MGSGRRDTSSGQLGRSVLPEPSWPDEPGSAGFLEPLRRFCNTVNRENGADAWRTPNELDAVARREGHGVAGLIDGAALHRFVTLRDAFWLGVRTNDFEPFARAAGVLDCAGRGDQRTLRWSRPVGGRRFVARLVLTVFRRRGRRRAGPSEVVPALPLGVPRHVQEPQRAMVLDGGVRRPQQGPRLPPQAVRPASGRAHDRRPAARRGRGRRHAARRHAGCDWWRPR